MQAISRSEIMLAHRPRPLGGRIAGEGGVGDWLGEWGNGMLDMCEMALLKEDRPLWNGNLESMAVIRRRISRRRTEI